MRRAGSGHDLIEDLERDVAIDPVRPCKTEGQAADGMARLFLDLMEIKHAGFRRKESLVFLVVEAGIAARDDQDNLVGDPQRQ